MTLEEIEALRAPFDRFEGQKRVDELLGLRRDHLGRPAATIAGESEVHRALKRLVAELAGSRGYRVSVEQGGDGFRADLVLEGAGSSLVVEVQLSKQNHATYKQRQRRYARAGLDCLWLVAGYPDGYTPSAELPLFRIGWPRPSAPAEGPHLGLPERMAFAPRTRARSEDTRALPLEQALVMLLDGELRFLEHASVTRYTELVGWEADCWRCHARQSVPAWEIRELGLTACGLPHDFVLHESVELLRDADPATGSDATSPADADSRIDRFSPEARELARRCGLSDEAVRLRHSKTQERSYMSFGCRRCDALTGDWFVRNTYLGAIYDPPVLALEALGDQPVAADRPHWCRDARNACEADMLLTAV
jgi:competence protein CoiA